MFVTLLLAFLYMITLFCGSHVTDNRVSRQLLQEHDFVKEALKAHLPLFDMARFTTIGPSVFPKPSDKAKKFLQDGESKSNITIHLQPSFGRHRPEQDAVMVFAAEYGLGSYILFLTTLRLTGYSGDVVMAISQLDYKDDEVRKYLQHDPNVIVYVVDYTCFNAEGQEVESAKGGIRVCQCPDLYGFQQKDGSIKPFPDPRAPRTVPTTRYELYWIWAQQYNQHSWLLLIDGRDTIFQSNPFLTVPRDDQNSPDGVLFFFGENVEATRLGKSPKNKRWLTSAYGPIVAETLFDKPTICSGASMGEQVAVDMYLRAMVGEFDETGTVLMGADQGFHNYLYYSQKLQNANAIRQILVQDQGTGLVNNLGALRTKELHEWGNGKIVTTEVKSRKYTVLNWDGVPSPVVHQFDRHKDLSKYWYKEKTRQYTSEWKKK